MKNFGFRFTVAFAWVLALSACASKTAPTTPENARIPASGKMSEEKLPSSFNKHSFGSEVVQTNYCWIVKIDRSEPNLQRYFMGSAAAPALLTENDIGKFTVLGEIQYSGFGGDGYPKFTDPANKAVSYDDAVKILETDDDCTAW